ncbi:hypothetical protein PRIPAC_86734 [Pristionchus pacificus]|uniref:Short-chain dehydrogenase/reductase 3 n=1 Tax=Pristionchus pacificus TaxID=54126 RepID=A0A2A6BS95_PRIPA|nr:hypothetical protein PRIPAC_86734 [Pristionchus pacificus]|eukprot:PDM68631.1 dehydrogenase [Pristionchus pacificus]
MTTPRVALGKHAPVTAAGHDDIHKKLEKVGKLFHVIYKILLIIWECVVAVVHNFAPLGFFPYKNIAGKTVLITGGANGLGRLIAERLADKGARLVLWDRDEKGLWDAKDALEKRGVTVHIRTVDMLNRQEIADAAAEARKEAGFIDILINNAGIGIGGRVVDVAEDAIRKTVELNTLCHFWMAKEFLPAMLSRNEGHIVSIASLGGLFASDQNMVPYCASKFGAVAIMEGLENETVCMGKDGVRFTTVCPSHFQTPLYDALKTNSDKKVMTVDEVVDWTVDGILREMRMVIVPRGKYIFYALKGILPRSVLLKLTTREAVANLNKQ